MPRYILIEESELSNLLASSQFNQKKDKYNSENNSENNSNVAIVILIILIIFIICCLFYVYNGSNKQQNNFVASEKSIKDLGIINNIYHKDPNANYSEFKAQISEFDPVKHKYIADKYKSGNLTADFIDKL